MNESQVKTFQLLLKQLEEWTTIENINKYATDADRTHITSSKLSDFRIEFSKETINVCWSEKAGCSCCHRDYEIGIPYEYVWNEDFRQNLREKTARAKAAKEIEEIRKEKEKYELTIKLELEQYKKLQEKYGQSNPI